MFVLLQGLIAPVKAGETGFNVLIKASRCFYSPEEKKKKKSLFLIDFESLHGVKRSVK